MLLGKRSRPPMRRTTSMTEFSLDFDAPMDVTVDATQPSVIPQQNDWLVRSHVSSSGMVSPRNNNRSRRSSVDMAALRPVPFLKACGLFKRRLAPGRDIYMYRGEVAFCSLECRQQLITQEERKGKCSLSSIMTETQAITAGSEASGNGSETVAAA